MNERGTVRIDYGKKKPFTLLDFLPSAAVALLLLAFPIVDFLRREEPSARLLVLDVCFAVAAMLVVLRFIRRYRQ
jgi:hypothetical protein